MGIEECKAWIFNEACQEEGRQNNPACDANMQTIPGIRLLLLKYNNQINVAGGCNTAIGGQG